MSNRFNKETPLEPLHRKKFTGPVGEEIQEHRLPDGRLVSQKTTFPDGRIIRLAKDSQGTEVRSVYKPDGQLDYQAITEHPHTPND